MATQKAAITVTADDTSTVARTVRMVAVPHLIHALDRKGLGCCHTLTFPLPEGEVVEMGRGDKNQTAFSPTAKRVNLADRTVSKRHLTLTVTQTEDGWSLQVEDQGSRNGVVVDGERVENRTVLDGTWIGVGSHIFVFRVVPLEWVRFFRHLSEHASAFMGQGPAAFELLDQVGRIANSRVPVVLEGQTGTGKEVLARELHRRSGRRGPFVGVNCAAIAENLIESELFGHARGAFTGAVQAKVGLVASADGGTLLLDEVGDMPLPVQAKLLRVLQEGEVMPVGQTRAQSVDVRVVTASHRNLGELTQTGVFRSDLFARLRGLLLRIPPLSERREDIGLLFSEGLRRAGADPGALSLSSQATTALFQAPWPHNTRQLFQVAAVAVALQEDNAIELEHLQGIDSLEAANHQTEDTADNLAGGAAVDSDDATAAVVLAARHRKKDPETFRAALQRLMEREQGNVTRVAVLTGFSRMQIYRWLKEVGWKP
jgi:DNA-binding NtrC family response regulator